MTPEREAAFELFWKETFAGFGDEYTNNWEFFERCGRKGGKAGDKKAKSASALTRWANWRKSQKSNSALVDKRCRAAIKERQ